MASDRIGEEGVIGFVTGAGWIEGNATDGMRKCLVEEFDKIYVFNLRGNQRTSGELSRREGGKIFGSGSRSPIAITILVRKRGTAPRKGKIFYCDIGDYFDREEKLKIIEIYKSISGISAQAKWVMVEPDKNNDWLNKGDDRFESLIPISKKQEGSIAVFGIQSLGVVTNRDAWCYNFSSKKLNENIKSLISEYNKAVTGWIASPKNIPFEKFVARDSKKIAWTRSLYSQGARGKILTHKNNATRISLYRPFTKSNIYFDASLNEVQYQTPKLFPESSSQNRLIIVTGVGASKPFSVLMTDVLPNLDTLEKSQCFPIFEYTKQENDGDLFQPAAIQVRQDAISDKFISEISKRYSVGRAIQPDEIFNYCYGLLHQPEFIERFSSNLTKSLPRIFLPKNFAIFSQVQEAGRLLGDLHVGYEQAPIFSVKQVTQGNLIDNIPDVDLYRVQKMRFAGTRGREDKTTVIYNQHITIKNIPLEAYEYVVNGKPALEWVMERQCVKVDKDSGISNDANDYAIETMNNPAYPFELFQRVITVSLETMKIVKSLPPLDLN
jgi:predicted helicase